MPIFTFFFLLAFIHPAIVAADDDSVESMNELRLVQEANLGNIDAQYRLAKLVYVGGISNWQSYDYKNLIREIALQGHEYATYDFFRIEEQKCIDLNRKELDSFENCFSEVRSLLVNLANQNKAHANYLLSWILSKEALESGSDLKRRMQREYIFRSSDLGSRSGMETAAHIILYEDPERSIQLFEQALEQKADYGQDAEGYGAQTCNILYTLDQLYSGEQRRVVDDVVENYTDLMDVDERLRVLEYGRRKSCPLLMQNLADYYFSSEDPDYLEIYMILTEVMQIYENRSYFFGGTDFIQLRLARSAIALNDPTVAKRHFNNIKDEDLRESLFGRYGEAQSFCFSQGVNSEDCVRFIEGG